MTINHPHLLEDADFTSQLPILFIPADPHPRRRPAGKLSVGHERMISQFHGHLASWWRYVYFCFPPDFSQRCCLLEVPFVRKPSHDFQPSKVCADHDFPVLFKSRTEHSSDKTGQRRPSCRNGIHPVVSRARPCQTRPGDLTAFKPPLRFCPSRFALTGPKLNFSLQGPSINERAGDLDASPHLHLHV
jgi:hypothetical protein